MSSRSNQFIIVIDDDPVMRLSCLKILKKEGYEVETFEDGLQGLARIQQRKPDLLVVDLKMPKIGGMEVIAKVHEIDPMICIIVITGYATIGTAVEAMKTGAYDFLPKPFTPDELRIIVERGMERTLLARKSIELKKEKENLERRFVTFVSHQLQSPLSVVQQYLEVLRHLKESPNKEELQQEWIDRSISRISELKEIVKDWLAISRIDSGNLSECVEPVLVPPLFENILEGYEPSIIEKNIDTGLDLPKNVSPVAGQKECLKMLFENLINNAIKYNKQNGKLAIKAVEEEKNVIFIIEDSGIGIPHDKLESIFDEFCRVKNDRTKDIPGTGLGLAICSKIVKEFGGTITVKTKLNIGSSFKVTLPKYKG
ncbi:hypothetical protein B6I21_02290 [candidate division KSB1 bacterium 4572_119]|nr:MAG: hypothetical protein B6I21_02290 [candidate division KSB1 bacterium 4572_119]